MAARGDGRSAVSGTVLHGRGRELDAIRTLIAAARAGSGGVLVVEGEPGAGKSALLAAATEFAPDFEVLRTRGIQSEAEFAFSGLAELLAPVSELMAGLVPEQQRALRSSLDAGGGGGASTGRLALATAVLALLTSAARRRPVLVVVDDAHWLDGSSLAVVGFVARRLAGTPIALLAARRGPEPQVGVDAVELRLQGLGAEAARGLLADLGVRARFGARIELDAEDERREPLAPSAREHPSPHLRLAPDEFDRLLAETRGNPLALIEMARLAASGALDLATLAGGREPLPSGVQLAGLYHDQVVTLPQRTRRALLIAAASFTGEAAPIEAALDAARLNLTDLAPAEQSGHVELTDGTVRFAHPLLRSAIYHGATDEAVRDAHHRLATSLAATTGPAAREQHAWHLSYATAGPDPTAATALADVAAAAARRGAPTAARQAYQRAAMIAPQPAAYLIEAAICARVEGDAAAALDLLDAAEEALQNSDIEDALHDRVRTERSRVDLSRTDPARLMTDLAEAAETASDPTHAADLTDAATAAAILGAHYREARTLAALALTRATPTTHAAAHAVAEHLALLLGESVLGTTEPTHSLAGSHAAAATEKSAPPLAESVTATDTVAEQSGHSFSESAPEDHAGAAATEQPAPPAGPTPAADAIAIAELRLGRTHSTAAPEKPALPRTEPDPTDLNTPLESLVFPAWTAALRETPHNLAPALKAAHDAGALSRLPPLLTMAAELALRAGHWDVARGRALAAADLGADLGQPLWPALALAVAARIAAYRSDRTDFDDLASRFAALPPIPADHPAALAFRHAEAVLALDEDRTAAIAELQAVADALHAHGIRHPAFVPVRADLDEALDRDPEKESPRDPFQAARRDLQAARRLRERRHHAEARALLEPARDTFRRLRARRWEALCEAELAALGPSRTTTEPQGLTPYETQVARHVGAGRTNNETAAALYISPKTVEYHLRNLYKKLGIRSRTELARIVATWDQDRGPT
ncbi:MAG: AAA family ATPase [Catenulispora sp.]